MKTKQISSFTEFGLEMIHISQQNVEDWQNKEISKQINQNQLIPKTKEDIVSK